MGEPEVCLALPQLSSLSHCFTARHWVALVLMSIDAIQLRSVTRKFVTGRPEEAVTALDSVSLGFPRGTRYASCPYGPHSNSRGRPSRRQRPARHWP
ncbi:hypothetical protein STRTUCAR8_06545 [Streptomyces turgidiscabies Car8]|uniref:Uncharacterized protein n=1 Tax=Streptomyces turgidiscabies (strain Car8) TaxID=698760 RepID=L7EZ23_STRT8|nr:hypothetical protein STRTUCAR8_06545 [Streptomyces turgidiscabies Car8]GAQ70673.1 hypothetical protein T45_02411 [Streptomyces turgidiscabies]